MISRINCVFKIFLITGILFFVYAINNQAAFCFNDDAKALFYNANSAYQKGEYNEAIKGYESILNQGLESGNIYYNVGNSYFKKGNLGKAILNYERARRLMPRDGDLISNYKYALSLIKEPELSGSEAWFVKLTNLFYKNFTVDEITVFCTFIFLIIVFVMILNLFVKIKRWRFVSVISILVITFGTSIISITQRVLIYEKEAIVISTETEARFEPREDATVHFTVFEGMKVYVIQTKGEWCKVVRPDKKAGWIAKSDLEKI